MKPRYRLLGSDRRSRVRGIARKSFHASGSDEDFAIELATAEIKNQFHGVIATLLLGIAFKLAAELILYWVKNRFSTVPSGGFLPGEPGFE
ncbi:MAG: hypothetical protein ACF788_01255 [Novipirellula sp. JB048]